MRPTIVSNRSRNDALPSGRPVRPCSRKARSSSARIALSSNARQSGIIANKGAVLTKRSSRPGTCDLALLQRHSAASPTRPARTGFNSTYRAAAIGRPAVDVRPVSVGILYGGRRLLVNLAVVGLILGRHISPLAQKLLWNPPRLCGTSLISVNMYSSARRTGLTTAACETPSLFDISEAAESADRPLQRSLRLGEQNRCKLEICRVVDQQPTSPCDPFPSQEWDMCGRTVAACLASLCAPSHDFFLQMQRGWKNAKNSRPFNISGGRTDRRHLLAESQQSVNRPRPPSSRSAFRGRACASR